MLSIPHFRIQTLL